MSQTLTLYNADLSPPVRVVKIVSKLIGLQLELRYEIPIIVTSNLNKKKCTVEQSYNFRNIDLAKGEHLQESFLKVNSANLRNCTGS